MIRKFLKLSIQNKILIVKFSYMMLLARITMILLPFKLFKNFWERNFKSRNTQFSNHSTVKYKIIWATNAVGRYIAPIDKSCLIKALVAYYFLIKNGYTVKLINGIRKSSESNLDVHAWVQENDEILIGKHTDIADFKPIYTFQYKPGLI